MNGVKGGYTIFGEKVFTNEKNGEHFEVKIPDTDIMCSGLYHMIDYVCNRFNVESTKELTDDQYSHGCAEYMTALIKESKKFRKFVKEHC